MVQKTQLHQKFPKDTQVRRALPQHSALGQGQRVPRKDHERYRSLPRQEKQKIKRI